MTWDFVSREEQFRGEICKLLAFYEGRILKGEPDCNKYVDLLKELLIKLLTQ